ncbi:MAG: alpha/beta hydrolase [Actinobacteria bacterium]|nr:alpha/beta hydrolase [Actinomycetota bacterium]
MRSPSTLPAVLLHGTAATHAVWLPVQRRLPQVRVLAPDRPGHGGNPRPPTDVAGNVAWLLRLLDRAGIHRTVLGCHGWAAGVGILAAARHPDRVAGLALVAPVGPHCVEPLDRLLTAPVLGEMLAWGGQRLAGGWLARRARQDLRAHLDPADLPAVLAELAAHARRPVWRTFLVEQRALVRQRALLEGATVRVTVPVLILAGTEDSAVPARTIESLATALPDPAVSWLEHTPHEVPLHAPEPVAAAIEQLTG